MSNDFMIFGIRPVIEAVKAGKEIDKVFVQKGLIGENSKDLMSLLRERHVHIQIVPIQKLQRLTRKNHQGVVCFISPISYTKLEDVLPFIYEKGTTPLVLLVDGVTDVRNFGAIARTAECAGVNAIVIAEKGGAQINADAIKTSAGALNKIPVCRIKAWKKTIEYLQASGLAVVACSEKGAKTIYDVDFNRPLAVIIGSEDTGVSEECLKESEEIAKIPIQGQIESLNVSVASGIVLYEVVRQRMSSN